MSLQSVGNYKRDQAEETTGAADAEANGVTLTHPRAGVDGPPTPFEGAYLAVSLSTPTCQPQAWAKISLEEWIRPGAPTLWHR